MKVFKIILLSMYLCFSTVNVEAQCSMCRAVASSNINDDERQVGVGLNTGILYLMAVPYLMGGVGFLIWYRNRKIQSN